MTAQIPNSIVFQDRRWPLHCLPFEQYIKQFMDTRPNYLGHTGLMHGYNAAWLIEDDRLFLVDFEAHLDGQTITLEDYFPASEGKVFAWWYTGTLIIPTGRRGPYRHAGWGRKYSRQIHIHIESGRVTSREEIQSS